MSGLEIDPNLVEPGWTPLLVTVLLGGALVLLFLSMRRQMRRIHVPSDGSDGSGGSDGENADPGGQPSGPGRTIDITGPSDPAAQGPRESGAGGEKKS